MATAAAPSRALPSLPGRRYDKHFFSGMAVLMLVIVFVGFAKSYFLAGMFRAPLPNFVVHMHGAVFTLWALTFVAQTSLVASGNVAIHRKLGLWAFGLAGLMTILGVAAASNALARNVAPFLDPKTFYAVPMFAIAMFAVLMVIGFWERRNAAAHKRWMTLATIVLMGAPTGRMPFGVITNRPHFGGTFLWILIALMFAYDLWSTHKIHPVTLWGGLAVIFIDQFTVPIGMSSGWHAFAGTVQAMLTH